MIADVLGQIDDGALWLAAVVAGLGALGWLGRKTWRGIKRARKFWREVAQPFMRKADAVLELAEYELQHNGGGSIKDAVARIQPLAEKVDEHIEQAAELVEQGRAVQAVIEGRLSRLEEQNADTLSHLAEAFPVVARSVPHPVDAHLPVDEGGKS